MRIGSVPAAIIIAFTSVVIASSSELADTTTSELRKIVVSATKQARSIHDIPVSATVIEREEILHSAAKNITDVVQFAMGVQVKCPVGMGEGVPSDIMMRGIPGGLTSSRVLILVDGIPTNLSGTSFLLLNQIPLEVVKKVEIIRGPFSSLYGANAFSGVINIITEIGDGRPAVKLAGETSFPFSAAHNYGVEGRQTGMNFWKESGELTYWNISAVAGGGNERKDILAAGGARTAGTYIFSDSAFVRNGDRKYSKSPENHDYTDYRLFLRSGVRLHEKAKMNIHMRYLNSELGFGKTQTTPDADILVKGDNFLAGMYLDFSALENLHMKIGGFGRLTGGEYFDRADSVTGVIVPTMWDVSSQDVQGEASAVYTPSDVVSIIAGADLLWSKIIFGALKFRSTGEVRPGEKEIVERFHNAGMYAQTDIKLPYCNVVPAIRADYHTEFGWMISPKLGASSRLLDHLTLRTSYGNAFRAPSTLELYSDMVVGTYKIEGNPDLLAENVQAFDCGFEMDFFKGVTVQSNFFYNKMENLITIDFDEKVINNIVGNGNLDDARSFGVENEITWNPLRSLKCSFNYTFTESENLRYEEPLDYIPRHKGNMTVMWADTLGPGVLRFSALEGFAGRRHYADWEVMPNIKSKRVGNTVVTSITPQFASLEPYFLTNISCSYTLKNKHEIALEIQNLFNAEIEQSGGTLLPGRFASLKYTVPINF